MHGQPLSSAGQRASTGTSLALAAFMAVAPQKSEASPEYNIADHHYAARIDSDLSRGCPKPAFDGNTREKAAKCADTIMVTAENIAEQVRQYMQNNPRMAGPILRSLAAGSLTGCHLRTEIVRENPAYDRLKNTVEYVAERIGAATACLVAIDNAEASVNTSMYEPAQRHLADAIDCYTHRDECVRPQSDRDGAAAIPPRHENEASPYPLPPRKPVPASPLSPPAPNFGTILEELGYKGCTPDYNRMREDLICAQELGSRVQKYYKERIRPNYLRIQDGHIRNTDREAMQLAGDILVDLDAASEAVSAVDTDNPDDYYKKTAALLQDIATLEGRMIESLQEIGLSYPQIHQNYAQDTNHFNRLAGLIQCIYGKGSCATITQELQNGADLLAAKAEEKGTAPADHRPREESAHEKSAHEEARRSDRNLSDRGRSRYSQDLLAHLGANGCSGDFKESADNPICIGTVSEAVKDFYLKDIKPALETIRDDWQFFATTGDLKIANGIGKLDEAVQNIRTQGSIADFLKQVNEKLIRHSEGFRKHADLSPLRAQMRTFQSFMECMENDEAPKCGRISNQINVEGVGPEDPAPL